MRLDGRKNFQSVKLLRQILYSELLPTNCLSVFDYFVGLVIKLLKTVFWLDSVKQTFFPPLPLPQVTNFLSLKLDILDAQ